MSSGTLNLNSFVHCIHSEFVFSLFYSFFSSNAAHSRAGYGSMWSFTRATLRCFTAIINPYLASGGYFTPRRTFYPVALKSELRQRLL